MSEKTDLKSILMEAKRKVEELPQSRSNRELWERINAPGSTHSTEKRPEPPPQSREKPEGQD